MTEQSYEEIVLIKDGNTRRLKLFHDAQGPVCEWEMAGGRVVVERTRPRAVYNAVLNHLLGTGWRALGPLEQLGDAANG